MMSFEAAVDEFAMLDDREDRYRFLIDLGRQLPPMPAELKTDASKVRGCSASVWLYPVEREGRLHFLADSDAHITKGIVALILLLAEGKTPADVLATDFPAELGPFELSKHLSSNRTQGVPNMIALIRETAGRLASPPQHAGGVSAA
ncbi:MAG: SufE family protein [Sphingomonadaceae bacterium]|nr:SufE family protein [Sphingomonadaceae bacterium]